MKKIVMLTTFAAASLSAPVFAQSSVTLYGLIDEGFDYTNNAKTGSAYQLQSGYAQGNRWGLKGTEDLGGGLKAVFQLENGFNVNSGSLGQGGLMFGRQAWVGLSSNYGTVTLGRQYDSIIDYFTVTTANGAFGGYLFDHPYDNDNTENTFRLNNTVKYASPTIYGIRFGGTYSFSNDSNFANNRAYSLGAQYSGGGLLIGVAYLQANNPSSDATGAITNAGDKNFVAARMRILGAGANYTLGKATVGLAYSWSSYRNPVSSAYVGSFTPVVGTLSNLTFSNFEANAKYQFTPAFYVGAQYVYTRANYDATSGESHPVYHTAGLMADYSISKRTDVYMQAAYEHVAGGKTGSVLDDAYISGAAGVSSSTSQVAVRVALRHKF